MIKRKNWNEFRETGLFLLVNQFLHIFGWSLVYKIENNVVVDVFPARVKFRGFNNEDTTEAYKKITKYMSDNIEELNKDIEYE